MGTGGASQPDGGVDIPPTACSTGTAQSGDLTVNLSGVEQRISGFGVSSAWAGSYANASDPDCLWSTTKGAGLSALRIRYGDGLAIPAPSGVMVSAYRNLADGTVVVVAINNNSSPSPLSLYISGVVPCSITPWVTSAADDLASKSAITVNGARFSATLDGQSVTSFVGTPQG